MSHAFEAHPDGRDRCWFEVGREIETDRRFRCWHRRRALCCGDPSPFHLKHAGEAK